MFVVGCCLVLGVRCVCVVVRGCSLWLLCARWSMFVVQGSLFGGVCYLLCVVRWLVCVVCCWRLMFVVLGWWCFLLLF